MRIVDRCDKNYVDYEDDDEKEDSAGSGFTIFILLSVITFGIVVFYYRYKVNI